MPQFVERIFKPLLLLLLAALVYVFYQFSQRGRYQQINYNTALDTHTGQKKEIKEAEE